MPRHKLTLEQRIFAYDTYVKTDSCREVCRLFLETFPGVPVPHRDTVRKLILRFREIGSINDRIPNRKRRVLTEDKLDEIGQTLERFPKKSLRCVSQEIGVSKSSAHRASKLLKSKPYRVPVVQELQPHDNMTGVKEISSNRCFGGYQKTFSHESSELGCKMNFSVYLPPQAEEEKLPVVYWLSGLTCTEQNFLQKAGAQRYAAEHGIIIVGPDTSPRGCEIAGEDDSWDFGSGAGFYIDATQLPWSKNYRMYSYVTKELPELVNSSFPVLADSQSIMGHSMGGHGALICALKNPGKYRSVSAFSPICNPTQCPWGKKAFSGYLGTSDSIVWSEWDATELVKKYSGPPLDILIDQGKDDQFLTDSQLLPENLVTACKDSQMPVILHLREGYDHSYFFIASFIGNHIEHHARYLKA